MTIERLLSTEEVAELLGVPATTLSQWRSRGAGPRGCVVGRHIRYRPSEVENWLNTRPAKRSKARR